mgnify:FL=1
MRGLRLLPALVIAVSSLTIVWSALGDPNQNNATYVVSNEDCKSVGGEGGGQNCTKCSTTVQATATCPGGECMGFQCTGGAAMWTGCTSGSGAAGNCSGKLVTQSCTGCSVYPGGSCVVMGTCTSGGCLSGPSPAPSTEVLVCS